MVPRFLPRRVPLARCCAAACLLFATAAFADVTMAPPFQSNMVLQRDIPAPVWGTAAPNEAINVTLDDKPPLVTAADTQGHWMVKLPPTPAGGPHTLTIAGNNVIQLTNVMAGDVWICAGQSNMDIGVGVCNDGAQEIAAADHPDLRISIVEHNVQAHPTDTVRMKWLVCTPENIKTCKGWGGFSAVGYYFGRDLQKQLNVPIGLIANPWSGMPIQPFISGDSLKTLPRYAPAVAELQKIPDDAADNRAYAAELTRWYAKNDPIGSAADRPYTKPDFNDAAWKSMRIPQNWEAAHLGGVDNYDGVVWFRRSLTLPPAWANHALRLSLGKIADNDTTFFNGTPVGATAGFGRDRVYTVPASAVHAGANVIAIRVLDTGGAGGLVGQGSMMLGLQDDSARLPPLPLAGDWKYLPAAALATCSPLPMQVNEATPTVLYNGMVNPLVPLAIKGVIWYQGESNAGAAQEYRTLLPMLIADWRRKFGVGDFPFYIVQLAAFQAKDTNPTDSAWAQLRDAQRYASSTVANTGLAITTDIGAAGDIHPRDKQDVGRRLALLALANTYHKNVECSGPVYTMMTIAGDTIHLFFSDADGLKIKSPDGRLSGFAIAGADGKFVWATASLDAAHNAVIVSSPEVPHPTAVRYDWSMNPDATLFNGADLPAGPFRTDEPGNSNDAK